MSCALLCVYCSLSALCFVCFVPSAWILECECYSVLRSGAQRAEGLVPGGAFRGGRERRRGRREGGETRPQRFLAGGTPAANCSQTAPASPKSAKLRGGRPPTAGSHLCYIQIFQILYTYKHIQSFQILLYTVRIIVRCILYILYYKN